MTVGDGAAMVPSRMSMSQKTSSTFSAKVGLSMLVDIQVGDAVATTRKTRGRESWSASPTALAPVRRWPRSVTSPTSSGSASVPFKSRPASIRSSR
jgi:hypothetical protein